MTTWKERWRRESRHDWRLCSLFLRFHSQSQFLLSGSCFFSSSFDVLVKEKRLESHARVKTGTRNVSDDEELDDESVGRERHLISHVCLSINPSSPRNRKETTHTEKLHTQKRGINLNVVVKGRETFCQREHVDDTTWHGERHHNRTVLLEPTGRQSYDASCPDVLIIGWIDYKAHRTWKAWCTPD